MKRSSIYARIIVITTLVVAVCGFVICCFFNRSVTTVILVRHADKTGQNLNELGRERADELVHVLNETNISAIYTSDVGRTIATAAPIALQLGIAPTEIRDSEELVDDLRVNHIGKTILVVHHSNTVPDIIRELGVIQTVPDIPENDYDNMYIVTLRRNSLTQILKLEYGADTE